MITSPLAHDYLGVIQTLDQLIFLLDGLWLMGVMNNKQRANAVFQWQRTIVKLGRRLIGRQRKRVNSSDTADNEDGDGKEEKKLEKPQEVQGSEDSTHENDLSSFNLSEPLEIELVLEPEAKVLAA